SPTSTVTVTPDSRVFTGETVNLKCVINSDHSDWRYEWYKDSVILQTSDRYTVNRDTLTIRGATESDQGLYWCKGQRDGRPNSSTSRSAVSLSVKERPKPVVKVKPDVRVFRGERVTLTCDIQETGVWRYSWYKDQDNTGRTDQIYNSAGQDQIYIITSVDPSHAGLYRCRGTLTETLQNSQISDGVTLTVSG
ncbi:hypothetical protein PO909_024888, partial [Leuciscus waleckii]